MPRILFLSSHLSISQRRSCSRIVFVMRMSYSSPQIDDNDGGGNVIHSIRDRFPFKRIHNHFPGRTRAASDRPSSRSRLQHGRFNRKGILWFFPFRGKYLFYFVIVFAVFVFSIASMVLQSSITSVFRQGIETRRWFKEELKFGSALKFAPGKVSRRFADGDGLDWARSKPSFGVRAPRLALVLGNMEKNANSLMLVTMIKNIQKLGYVLKIFATENGKALSMWEQLDGKLSILRREHYNHIYWSMFDGVVADSLEAKEVISSLTHEPFCSIPLIWIIQDDTLANRFPLYEKMGWKHLISHWKSSFSRANVVVFPNFALPMLYSVVDPGNFYMISGPPLDVWGAEMYNKAHSKYQLRKGSGFSEDDLIVLVVGNTFYYTAQSWDYAEAMQSIGPLLSKYARKKEASGLFKFVFLCGNAAEEYGDALQAIASRLGLLPGSLLHYGLNNDSNSMFLMADIVLYASSQDTQGFPPLLTRAMAFGIPVIAPDLPVVRTYMVDGVHGIIFPRANPTALVTAFSLLISNGKPSKLAYDVASSGSVFVKSIFASECINEYAKLLENLLNFPSDAMLPNSASLLQEVEWEWNLFRNEMELENNDQYNIHRKSNIIFSLEKESNYLVGSTNFSELGNAKMVRDTPSQEDWESLEIIENIEEYERVDIEELEERVERDLGEWDEIYRNVRKSYKLKFETNERDEGELERTGQPVCIYELYKGAGAWPFLHLGSLYRGLSLSTRGLRIKSDDVNAVSRLPLLNDTYYRDILCEIGGMFAVANDIDEIHQRPWIGFQSWQASGRKVSLSTKAEMVLEEIVQKNTRGDVIYFWSHLGINGDVIGSSNTLTFWSMCDILNGGHCRATFEDSFRHMYDLPSHIEALPPMPEDGGRWSSLHSWVMPTPSFLEFIMFSRMFADSLDELNTNASRSPNIKCLLSSSKLEEKHCYCRVLEILVNIWAYHSGRKMVYIDPHSGLLEEQHPVEKRKGFMWEKYFDMTILKSMDEDLAEAADDGDHPRAEWLWPLIGEVHWKGIYEREREERYRLKMDKKRKTKDKLFERMKHGYKQKSLGG